jgi:hypothetical protein
MPTARTFQMHSVQKEHAAVMHTFAPSIWIPQLVRTQQNGLHGWGNETVLWNGSSEMAKMLRTLWTHKFLQYPSLMFVFFLSHHPQDPLGQHPAARTATPDNTAQWRLVCYFPPPPLSSVSVQYIQERDETDADTLVIDSRCVLLRAPIFVDEC